MHKLRFCTWLLVPALVGGAAPLHGQDRRHRPLAPNPSAFIAADIGFGRMAQDKGVAAAVREYGDAQAQIMPADSGEAPAMAREWSKGGQPSFRLSPHAVVVSCDGNMAVTQGRWISEDASGSYLSLWTRDEKGRLKWRLHQRSGGAASSPTPNAGDSGDDGDDVAMVRTQQAVCQPKAAKVPQEQGASTENWSADGSLSWSTHSMADGRYDLRVALWNGKVMATVFGPTAELVQQ